MNMGIPKYLILDSLIGVIAQRLVGKKCDYCSGEGCEECSGGYRGRTSINEVLIVGDEVKNILKSENLGRKSKEELKRNAEKYFVDFDGDIKDKLSKKYDFWKRCIWIYRLISEGIYMKKKLIVYDFDKTIYGGESGTNFFTYYLRNYP